MIELSVKSLRECFFHGVIRLVWSTYLAVKKVPRGFFVQLENKNINPNISQTVQFGTITKRRKKTD